MQLVTAAEMRALETAAETAGLSSLTLMENAGTIAAAMVAQSLAAEQSVTIVCGKGNNAGDGLVMARLLARAEISVTVIHTVPLEQLSPSARANAERLTSSHIRVRHIQKEADVPDSIEGDIIVDCLLGTGATGEPSPLYAKLITAMNHSHGKVIAMDLPSGVQADSGACAADHVKAQETFTLGLPKYGLFVSPGREAAGTVEILPIGLPEQIDSSNVSNTTSVEVSVADEIAHLLPARPPDGHKGTFGKVLIIGGSAGLSGAPRLSALGALHSGCGLAKIACPESIRPEIAMSLMEVTTRGLPDVARKGVIALRSLGEIRALAKEHDAVAVGPGIGRHHETIELVRRFVDSMTSPIVIDADALFALGDIREKLFEIPHILTPHEGEFVRLFGVTPPKEIHARVALIRATAMKQKITLVMKGSPTIVASHDGMVTINSTGNDGMATGGTGDILAGMIATMLAQGLTPYDAACVAVYVHGLAGDIAAEHQGRRGMTATDVAACIPEALLKLDTLGESVAVSVRP